MIRWKKARILKMLQICTLAQHIIRIYGKRVTNTNKIYFLKTLKFLAISLIHEKIEKEGKGNNSWIQNSKSQNTCMYRHRFIKDVSRQASDIKTPDQPPNHPRYRCYEKRILILGLRDLMLSASNVFL